MTEKIFNFTLFRFYRESSTRSGSFSILIFTLYIFMNLPDPIKNFIHYFSKLPSIGPRQATRLAFHVIGSGKDEIEGIINSLEGLESMSVCEKCFFVFLPQNEDDKLCEICRDPKRDPKIIAIVEKETDLISIEKTNKFNGNYFIIGNLQKNGVLGSEQKRRLEILKNNIKNEVSGPSARASTELGRMSSGQGQIDEIIIATNPTTYGDFNAAILGKELKDLAKKITRLGRGIPTGGEIEFADEDTLGNALERRL